MLISLLLILGVGDQRIVAYTVQDTFEPTAIAYAYSSDMASLKDTVAHSIQTLMPGEGYEVDTQN